MSPATALEQEDCISFGHFTLLPNRRRLMRDGGPVQIGDRAFELLATLLERPGDIFSKEELADRVWGRRVLEDVNIRVTVSNLRKILGRTSDDDEYVLNVTGRGYCFSGAVSTQRLRPDGVRGSLPSVPSGARGVGRLPLLLKPVFGRGEDVERIVSLLSKGRFVTLTGPGGIGKTTAAVAAATRLGSAHGLPCFVDFAPIQDPALVLARVAAALDAEQSGVECGDAILARLGADRRLLVFDNCEHVIEAVADVAERILAATEGVKIVATSREPLRAEGEVVLRLDGLACPPDGTVLGAGAAMEFSAVQLFVERVQAAQADFVMCEDMVAATVEICRRLDGMALALQLAASRVPVFGVAGVASRLDDRFRLLTHAPRTAVARHRTIEAALDWSFDLLSDAERQLFMRLSVFCSRFTIDAATEVAGNGGVGDAVIEVALAGLVDKSLVVFTGEQIDPSYRMLETIREFAFRRLVDAQEDVALIERHAQRVMRQCGSFPALTSTGRNRRATVEAKDVLDDLRGALRRSFASSDATTANELAVAAIPLLMHLGLTSELRGWMTRALKAEGQRDRRLALTLGLAAALHLTNAGAAEQISLYDDAYALAADIGSHSDQLRALWGLVMAYYLDHRPRDALRAAQSFRDLARSRGEANDAMVGECLVGCAVFALGDLPTAKKHFEHMLAHYPPSASVADAQRFVFNQRTVALKFLAQIEHLVGEQEKAWTMAEHAALEAGDHLPSFFLALSHGSCMIAIDRGDWTALHRSIEDLTDSCAANPRWQHWIDVYAAVREIHVERSSAALERLSELLAEAAYPLPGDHVWCRLQLVKAHAACGDIDSASALIGPLLQDAREREELWLLPDLLHQKALLASLSDPAGAEGCFKEAVSLARRNGARFQEAAAAVDFLRWSTPVGRGSEGDLFLADPLAALAAGFDPVALFPSSASREPLQAESRFE